MKGKYIINKNGKRQWARSALVKRAKRKEHGLCIQCGHAREELTRTKCLRCVEKNRLWSKDTVRRLKLEAIAGYGGKCICCGETYHEFLNLDHALESRSEEQKRTGRVIHSATLYHKVIRENFPAQYELRCFNCNLALGFFGYCPHRPEVIRPTWYQKRLDIKTKL